MIRTHQASNIADPVCHGFFSRRGGVSSGLYEGLNVGLGSSDARDMVQENRRLALAHLVPAGATLCTAYQIHSAEVVIVEEPWSMGDAPQVDAMVTAQRGIALGIVTADCAPVLFADAGVGVVGAAHAGWKGALAGVLQATVEAMENLGARRGNISAAIGPAIAQESYEVGANFRAAFLDADAGAASFFAVGQDGRFQFDLTGYVESTLKAAGIESVWAAGVDTYTMEQDFFSYRRSCHRDEGDYGRQLSAILLV